MYILKLKYDGKRFSNYNRIWFVILTVSLPIVIFLSSLLFNYTHIKKSYDGTVRYKYQDQMPDKHGDIYRVDKKLIVKFDSVEEPKELLVTPNTYFSVKEGQRVTFNMRYDELHKVSAWITISEMLLFICALVNIIALLVYIVMWINHMFSNYELMPYRVFKIRKDVDPYGEEQW